MEFIKKGTGELLDSKRSCKPQPCNGDCTNKPDTTKIANTSEKAS